MAPPQEGPLLVLAVAMILAVMLPFALMALSLRNAMELRRRVEAEVNPLAAVRDAVSTSTAIIIYYAFLKSLIRLKRSLSDVEKKLDPTIDKVVNEILDLVAPRGRRHLPREMVRNALKGRMQGLKHLVREYAEEVDKLIDELRDDPERHIEQLRRAVEAEIEGELGKEARRRYSEELEKATRRIEAFYRALELIERYESRTIHYVLAYVVILSIASVALFILMGIYMIILMLVSHAAFAAAMVWRDYKAIMELNGLLKSYGMRGVEGDPIAVFIARALEAIVERIRRGGGHG